MPCIVCGQSGEVQLTDREFQAWQDGASIQTAAPRLSEGEAELLITGTHPDCWDKMFEDEEEEQEDSEELDEDTLMLMEIDEQMLRWARG